VAVKKKNMKNTFYTYSSRLILPLLILMSILTIKPLFTQGYFPMHDDTQVSRVFVMKQALADGQFPVRIVDGLGYGYGYPLFNFYSPGPYYIGGLLAFIVSPLIATKVVMGLGMLLAGVGMYVLARQFFDNLYSFIPAILYTFAPYHASQLYVRGAVAELWAYAMLPFISLFLYNAYKKKHIHWIILGGLSYALLILSHNSIAVIATGFIVLISIALSIRQKSLDQIKPIVITMLLGLLLSAFFWLPAMAESSATNVGRLISEVNYLDHFLFLDQLWSSPWGFAGSAVGRADGMSFILGKAHMIIALFSIIWVRKKHMPLAFGLVAMLVVSIFMMLPISMYIWKSITLLQFTQFPWRFLVFANFAIALLGGFISLAANKIPKALQIAGVIGISLLVMSINIKYFQPQYIRASDGTEYTEYGKLSWDISKISDEYLPTLFRVPQSKNEVPTSLVEPVVGVEIESVHRNSNSFSFIATSTRTDDQSIIINIAQFPHWNINRESTQESGRLRITVPKGTSTITGKFTNTPIRTIANFLSILGLGSIMTLLIYGKRFKKAII